METSVPSVLFPTQHGCVHSVILKTVDDGKGQVDPSREALPAPLAAAHSVSATLLFHSPTCSWRAKASPRDWQLEHQGIPRSIPGVGSNRCQVGGQCDLFRQI